jgi:hypothetical protein
MADPAIMERVIVNLVGNALRTEDQDARGRSGLCRPAQRRNLPLGGNHRRGARRDLGHVRDAVLPGLVASYIIVAIMVVYGLSAHYGEKTTA